MPRKKVVVTGMGALAPNGNSAILFWEALKSGISGGKIFLINEDSKMINVATGDATSYPLQAQAVNQLYPKS